jgi:hypothetical protein
MGHECRKADGGKFPQLGFVREHIANAMQILNPNTTKHGKTQKRTEKKLVPGIGSLLPIGPGTD